MNRADKLKSICILDGRNRDKMEDVSRYFSEFALIQNRVRVEVSYLIFLSENTKVLRRLNEKEKDFLSGIWKSFSDENGLTVKDYETSINHDVKAVEYFLRYKLSRTTLKDIIPFIHIGLTSYDINIPAYALMLSGFRRDVLLSKLLRLLKSLKEMIIKTKSMPMLGRTHGQPALPTTMGKELAVFYSRLMKEFKNIKIHQFEAKLTGAVGNFNALTFVYPHYDWITLSHKFIKSLGLVPNIVTTQIMPYDNWLTYFDSLKRFNNILNGLCQDIWWYIGFDYFQQKKLAEEVGSSTMSNKINPITFENAEGNLQLANSLFEFFVRKLSVTRLQRDLSDSTIKRDFGLAFGFTLLAIDSLISGFSRISPDPRKMKEDLDEHWEIFSEGIQTYLRSKGIDNAFELIKRETRGKTFTKAKLDEIIDKLPLNKSDKKRLSISNLDEYMGKTSEIITIALKDKI